MTRLLLTIAFILLPFLIFALYRLATQDMSKFRQKWPFALLTLSSFLLLTAFYGILFIRQPHGKRYCPTPTVYDETQHKLVKGERRKCENASTDVRDSKATLGSDRDDDE